MSQRMAKDFFVPQNQGNIVNITANVVRGFPGLAHTGAARAGVENMTKSLSQEWAQYNIRINAVAPGVIASEGLENYPETLQKNLNALKDINLMKRLGTVEDIANAVMFFASPLSSYISGTIQMVDGLEHLADDRMILFNNVSTYFGKGN